MTDNIARGIGASVRELQTSPRGTGNLITGTRRLQTKLAQVRANDADCNIAFVGNSLFSGVGAAGGIGSASTSANRLRSAPHFAKEAISRTLRATDSSWWGGTTIAPAAWSAYDSRVTVNSWTFTSSGLCSSPFTQTVNDQALIFAPTEDVTHADIYYLKYTGGGQFAYQVDGGAWSADISHSSASQSIVKLTVSLGASGVHTLGIKRSSGGSSYIVGVLFRNETNRSVNIMNMGHGGSTTETWVGSSQPRFPLPAVTTIAPDAIILSLVANDYRISDGVELSRFRENLQTMIDAWSPASDIIISIDPPGSVVRQTIAIQDQYNRAAIAVAKKNGLAYIDSRQIYGSYALSQDYYVVGDTIHQNGVGYAHWGSWIGGLIANLPG